MVATTALQVALVLSAPRTTAGHQQLELFVLMGGVRKSGECRQDRKSWKITPIDDERVLHHHDISVGTCKYLPLAVPTRPEDDAAGSCITCAVMGVLPWR